MNTKLKWTPDLKQEIDALTTEGNPSYDEELASHLLEKYDTIDNFKKSDKYNQARNERKIKEEELIELGFYKYQNFFTFYIYELENGKHLSLSNLGTPNEFLFICDGKNIENPTDTICIHNSDKHGYMTLSKMELIVALLTNNPF